MTRKRYVSCPTFIQPMIVLIQVSLKTDENLPPLDVSMLPDLNAPDSQFIAGKDNYKHKIYKLFCLLASQTDKLDLQLESLRPVPEHKDECLQAAEELEKLGQLCRVWEDAIEHCPYDK